MVGTSGISFSGLASGLDTQAIVRQLVALERIPIQMIEAERSTEQGRLDKLSQFSGLVKALQERAESLSTSSGFLALSISGVDPNIANVTADETAEAGTHTIEVNRLAAIDRWAFDGVVDPDTDLASAAGQVVAFQVGTTSYNLEVAEEASSLNEIAAEINEAAGDDVSATVVNVGTGSSPSYQLVLASKTSGEDGRITNIASSIDGLSISYSAPNGSGGATSANNLTVGLNAVATVDGLQVTRSNNDFSDVLTGISVDLAGIGSTTFTVEPDKAGIRSELDDFVTSYNDVINFINTQNTYTPAADEDSRATVGALFGDSTLSSVKAALSRSLFNVPLSVILGDTEGYSTMSNVGIQQNSDGTLEINESVFDEKILANLDAFADLFVDRDGFQRDPNALPNTPEYYQDTTADSGLFASLGRELDRLFGSLPDGDDDLVLRGIFDLRKNSIQASIDRLNDRIETKERALEGFEESLVLRFSRLEELMGNLNAQGAALGSALSSF